MCFSLIECGLSWLLKGCCFFFKNPCFKLFSWIHLSALCAHWHRFQIVCSAAAFSRRDGAGQQREDPVFAANIPFKVALFAALTGHEYQAEGAEGAVDSTPTGCRTAQLQPASNAIYVSSMLPAPVVSASCNLVFVMSSCQQWSYIAVFISF